MPNYRDYWSRGEEINLCQKFSETKEEIAALQAGGFLVIPAFGDLLVSEIQSGRSIIALQAKHTRLEKAHKCVCTASLASTPRVARKKKRNISYDDADVGSDSEDSDELCWRPSSMESDDKDWTKEQLEEKNAQLFKDVLLLELQQGRQARRIARYKVTILQNENVALARKKRMLTKEINASSAEVQILKRLAE